MPVADDFEMLPDEEPSTEPSSDESTTPTVTEEMKEKFYNRIVENISVSMGQGSFGNYLQTSLSRLDRYGTLMIPLNHELSGVTFITRPKLNLSGANIRQNSMLSTLNTMNPNSISFMIRALLDTKLASAHDIGFVGENMTNERLTFLTTVDQCPLINPRSPWLTPLCNCVTDISGFPDFILETETTAGGFYSEDMTFAKGSDMFNKSTELSLSFRDVQGGAIMAILLVWDTYIALQCIGEIMAYAEDIYEQRLNYTCSIYRFVFDSSREVITGWCKATGCYPKSVPIGARFNLNQGELYSSSAARFSVPFVANKIEYMNPEILTDFNMLATRYWPDIASSSIVASNNPEDNMLGLPFIVNTNRGLELKYFYTQEEAKVSIDALTEIGLSGQDASTVPSETYEYIKDWRIYDQVSDSLNSMNESAT